MPILQKHVPEGVPWRFAPANRLPGLSPLPLAKWVLRDEAFAQQMTLRDQLLEDQRADVVAVEQGAIPAAQECLTAILTALKSDPGYTVASSHVVRPDGVSVTLNFDDPLGTTGRLVQCDMCLMQAQDTAHVLTGAVLCFPASWRLSEKIGKPLMAIHAPVPEYDADLATRVQRVFDALRPGTVLTRSNALLYQHANLYSPDRKTTETSPEGTYVRTERQTLRRLPKSNAVVFGIHTTILSFADLPIDEQRRLKAAN